MSAEVAEARRRFRQSLFEAGLLFDTGVPGVVGSSGRFESIMSALQAHITRAAQSDCAELRRFPAVMSRAVFKATGHIENFPQLCGSVHSFFGGDAEHMTLLDRVAKDEDWGASLQQTNVMMTPSACYPLYPTLKGRLPEGGRTFEITGDCFRHEPSEDPARFQAFRMREQVRLADESTVRAWRSSWMERGHALLQALGLEVTLEVANDPFFGRGGRLMRANQAAQELKFELMVSVTSSDAPTAVGSFNYHQEHFGHLFGIEDHKGATAHSACLGFGLERVVLALLSAHGLDSDAWTKAVRKELWP